MATDFILLAEVYILRWVIIARKHAIMRFDTIFKWAIRENDCRKAFKQCSVSALCAWNVHACSTQMLIGFSNNHICRLNLSRSCFPNFRLLNIYQFLVIMSGSGRGNIWSRNDPRSAEKSRKCYRFNYANFMRHQFVLIDHWLRISI